MVRFQAEIKGAIADEQEKAAKLINSTAIAKAQRDFELKKATYDQEVNAKVLCVQTIIELICLITFSFKLQKAEAELAYELQAAIVKQKLREEEMQIKLVERQQQILIQEQEILRKEKELEATVRRPAEAEKFKYI